MFKRMAFVLAVSAPFLACSGPQTPPVEINSLSDSSDLIGQMTFTTPDGLEIAATVHSVGKPTVVLIHGWMCDQSYWSEQVPALFGRFGVVTVDLAGHGRSGAERTAWTISSLAEDVAALINSLNLDRVVVVGHSMGGRVGLEIARLVPSSVIAVVGVDTLHDAEETWDPSEASQFLAGLEQDFAATCDPFVRSMFGKDAETVLIDQIAADMCDGPSDVGFALLRDYVDYDLRQAFINANVPIRCINADKWPTAIETNQRYCDFQAAILEGCGHFVMQERPRELNDALIDTITSLSENSQPTTRQ